MTCGAAQARRLGMTARRLRFHRQHVRFHGRLRQRRRTRARSSSSRTAISPTASWRRLSNTARGRFRWRPISTRSWRWCACWPKRLGIYLLNSINPFRIEGQKTIMIEMMDQRDWRVPDWVVLPGGNLGNISAFGKALARTDARLGFIDRLPRLAVIQAAGSAPFYNYCAARSRRTPCRARIPKRWPRRSTSAIRSPGRRRCTKSRLLERRGRTGDGAGDRRRQSDDRPVRHRLRTGFGGNAGGIRKLRPRA